MKARSAAKDFPVVCVGGSAGGLDAYIRLLRHLPVDMGVAIVIVNHVRTVATLLHEILLKPISKPRGWPDVITVFLRSLTKYWDGKLIAVN